MDNIVSGTVKNSETYRRRYTIWLDERLYKKVRKEAFYSDTYIGDMFDEIVATWYKWLKNAEKADQTAEELMITEQELAEAVKMLEDVKRRKRERDKKRRQRVEKRKKMLVERKQASNKQGERLFKKKGVRKEVGS